MSPRRILRPLLALLLAAGALASGAVEAQQRVAPDTIQARVRACAACHGTQGQGTDNDYFPRLAGKPAGYLFNQLKNFREGRRRYPPMNYLVTYLPDAYLHEIADYFSSLHPPYPTPQQPTLPASVVAHGQDLVMHGDPAHGIPACAACHGANLTGTEPNIPGLIGLHADYISAQLGAWHNGVRASVDPTCMEKIAPRLSDTDVAAVAAWLASQPAPQNARPAPADSVKLPANCGL